MQPPNPAPVIRAATTPGDRSRDLDHRIELGRADLEQVAQRGVALGEQPPDGVEVAGGEGRRRSPPTRAFSLTMCSARANATGSSRSRAAARTSGVTSRRLADPRVVAGEFGHGRLALAAPLVVRRAVEMARRPGVEDDERRRRPAAGSGAIRAIGNRGGRPSRRRRTPRRTGPSARSGRRRSRSPRAGRCARA